MSPTAQIMLGLVLGLIVGYVISTFDDAVTQSVRNGNAPFSSRFQPATPLSALKGLLVTGQYTLEIRNENANGLIRGLAV